MNTDINVNSPRVSIVMSVFNGGSEVVIAVDSIICQSYQLWELVIVDDGSTDNTSQIVKQYAKKHQNIRVLTNKINMGLAYSLNEAIKHSNGEYIARMDADDIALPNRIEEQVNYFDSHPKVSVLGTGSEVVTPSKKTIVLKPETHEEIVKSIEKINPFFHSSVMMRRDFVDAMSGYSAKYLRAQDYDLWLRGVDQFRYHNLQKVLMTYSSRNQSLQSIYYGLKVRCVNAYRRHRIIIGLTKAILVFLYGIWIKIIRLLR